MLLKLKNGTLSQQLHVPIKQNINPKLLNTVTNVKIPKGTRSITVPNPTDQGAAQLKVTKLMQKRARLAKTMKKWNHTGEKNMKKPHYKVSTRIGKKTIKSQVFTNKASAQSCAARIKKDCPGTNPRVILNRRAKCKKPVEKEIHRQYANQWYKFATSKI